jgi:hypothetical protein
MKKFLLSCALLATTLAFFTKANAQCTISAPGILFKNSVDLGNGKTRYTFDLNFINTGNNGNKFQVIHLWTVADYNTAAVQNIYGNSGNSAPSVSALNSTNCLATVVFNNTTNQSEVYNRNGSGTPVSPQPTTNLVPLVTQNSSGAFTAQNVYVDIPNSGSNVVMMDVWSTQSSSLNSVSCLQRNNQFIPNDPTASGLFQCGTLASGGNKFSLSINSNAPGMTVAYKIYKDNGNGQYDGSDALIYTSANLTTPYSATNLTYPGSNLAGDKSSLWIQVYNVNNPTYTVTVFLENTCAPLPVSFKSFTANRNKQNVSLKWETASEENNRGFNVQRKLPNGDWQTIAFVFSAAQGGNSSSVLSYSYNDLNTAKGVSQYRLQQVDMDNRAKYSEIRSVRSEEMPSKLLVFPNPSVDGKVNVVFDDATSVRDIIVSDVAGRIIKKYNGVNGSSLVIDNLNEGFYSIQVTDRTTSTMSVEKVVIKKR